VETVIKPAAITTCWGIYRDKLGHDLESVPLSKDTIARRITDLAQDIKCQLIDRVKKGKCALKLD